MTLSGGEPTAWPRFAAALLDRCRAAGIHTALDTCGQCREEPLRALAERADLVLYDLKEIDPAQHERFTGRPNGRILANAQHVAAIVRASRGTNRPQRLWIRTPLIPRATANERTVGAIGAFIAAHLGDAVERWELCAFNPLCEAKYRQLGRAWDWAGTPLLTTAEVAALADVARAAGVAPAIVHATGPTRVGGEGGA